MLPGTGHAGEVLAWIAYLSADRAAALLPIRTTRILALGLARVAFALRLPARRILEQNLSRVLPGAPRSSVRARARESFEHFALSFVDFLRLARTSREDLASSVLVRGEEHLAAARASERGVIVLSAHAGNWEWGAAWLAHLGERVHVAARRHPSRWVEAFFTRRRGSFGVSRLSGRPLWLAAARVLRRGEWVALMGDRLDPDRRGSLCAWAAALARRTGAVVLPAVVLRLDDGRYAVCFELPLEGGAALGRHYRDAMRRHLLRDPGQWFAFEPLPDSLA